ncbi:DUF3810 domain-containing protein [uncultured Dokdonia sp.]|uniref:DUF3810 domain-containing protein n=1 Tax=uncultured Dokdonia sp. TaxID=575653 RepID=UPI002612E9F2|nr:DUF3810 domain-containing protein [uncultured Dokdonia sp.]
MKQNRKLLIIGLFLFIQMGIVRVLALFPEFIENYYSNGLYPLISKGFRYTFGWLPFSFGDIMYSVLIIIALREIVLLFKSRFRQWKTFSVRTLALASIVYGAFHLLWGMNYYRLPLHESLSIESEYTTKELVVLTQKLILKSNALYDQLASNDTMAVDVPLSKSEVFDQTVQGYNALQTQFPKLDYPPKSIKTSLLSYPLSVMGYSGYLNPITNEAHINGLVPSHRHPVISCHEQAHQLGFAKENEANFIGVLATLHNENPYFQYSGSIFALRYCINDVFRRDSELGENLRDQIRPGILKNYAASREFWDRMDNPLEPFFKLFYTNYLKANNQPDGIKSYSYMVALLVNYNKSFPLAL